MGAFIDLTGKKINRLTVIGKGTKHGNVAANVEMNVKFLVVHYVQVALNLAAV